MAHTENTRSKTSPGKHNRCADPFPHLFSLKNIVCSNPKPSCLQESQFDCRCFIFLVHHTNCSWPCAIIACFSLTSPPLCCYLQSGLCCFDHWAICNKCLLRWIVISRTVLRFYSWLIPKIAVENILIKLDEGRQVTSVTQMYLKEACQEFISMRGGRERVALGSQTFKLQLK